MAIESLKLHFSFDPEHLKQDLNLVSPAKWTPHFNMGYYIGEWSGVALRSVGGDANALYPDPVAQKPYAGTPALARCDYIQSVLASFECEMESVRLLKLSAGSKIREHKDYKLGIEDGVMRIHIPIITDPRVEFFVNNRRLMMNEGECWYINFNLPHRVNNHSDIDRVHLVIDCIVNDWARSMIAYSEAQSEPLPAARSTVAEKSKMPGQGLEQFRQLVLEDTTLQKKLIETPNLKAFLALTLQLGDELGYSFTVEDLENAMRESRLAWLQRWI
ncbi:MAG TPA: aspartyl/asparaginyl beta-hydroxylase domain-containing protein [Blastocatellia bacterium]|jgi:hypothetical protein